MLALIVAGCSSTSGGTGKDAAPKQTKALKFADCMRENGVKEFPDPDASEGLTIDGVLNGSSLDPESATWKAAIAACRDLQPPGFTGPKNVTDAEQEKRLEFAQCIRDNGVKDFPDPAKGEPLVNTYRIPSAATEGGMSILNAAMRKCRGYASAAGVQGSR